MAHFRARTLTSRWHSIHFRFGISPIYSLEDHLEIPWNHYASDYVYDYQLERITLKKAMKDEVVCLINEEDS
jgi:hypothetical protein